MVVVGIEAMNVFGGSAYLDVMQLAQHRQLDPTRFENLLMKEKAVALPYEDPVTFGVNAAKPLVDALSEAEKTESKCLSPVQNQVLILGNQSVHIFTTIWG